MLNIAQPVTLFIFIFIGCIDNSFCDNKLTFTYSQLNLTASNFFLTEYNKNVRGRIQGSRYKFTDFGLGYSLVIYFPANSYSSPQLIVEFFSLDGDQISNQSLIYLNLHEQPQTASSFTTRMDLDDKMSISAATRLNTFIPGLIKGTFYNKGCSTFTSGIKNIHFSPERKNSMPSILLNCNQNNVPYLIFITPEFLNLFFYLYTNISKHITNNFQKAFELTLMLVFNIGLQNASTPSLFQWYTRTPEADRRLNELTFKRTGIEPQNPEAIPLSLDTTGGVSYMLFNDNGYPPTPCNSPAPTDASTLQNQEEPPLSEDLLPCEDELSQPYIKEETKKEISDALLFAVTMTTGIIFAFLLIFLEIQ